MFPSDEYRREAGIFQEWPGHYDCVGTRRKGELRIGGFHLVAGAAIQWLRDNMKMIDSSMDSEYMAKKVHGTHGCYVVPAFTDSARRTGISMREARSWV